MTRGERNLVATFAEFAGNRELGRPLGLVTPVSSREFRCHMPGAFLVGYLICNPILSMPVADAHFNYPLIAAA